jgi:hypothetical protein
VLVIVKGISLDVPSVTLPKSRDDDGLTKRTGPTTAPIPNPVTSREAPPPPVKFTLLRNVPATVGLNLTITVACPFPGIEYEPPDTILYGAVAVALPVSTPPPTFLTVKGTSNVLPTLILPKSREFDVTEITGLKAGWIILVITGLHTVMPLTLP